MKTKQLFAGFCLVMYFDAQSQCLTPPSFPDCTGSESLVTNNETLTTAQTKWYYGAASTLSNIKLKGGTLIVCSDLTINDLVLDSGIIVVKPGAKLIVSNGAGLVMKGGAAIYNWGIFQSLGNIVMDYGTASATRPNLIINATPASVWQMPNQYFVINNPYSKFVNMGTASFHGIITDPGAGQGSVCLGNGSMVNMMVLHNKSKNSYIVPGGSACVSVSQFSQFYDTLTANSNLQICLGATHYSDASCVPWGCKPNAWGAAQIKNNCLSCAGSFTVLPLQFRSVTTVPHPSYNEIKWEISTQTPSIFYLQYSSDGRNFTRIDSIKGNNEGVYSRKHFSSTPGIHYYRIECYQPAGEQRFTSRVITSVQKLLALSVFPNPFRDHLMLYVPADAKKLSLTLTDVYGRVVHTQYLSAESGAINLGFTKLAKGYYLLRIEYGGRAKVLKIQKEE